MNAHVTLSQIGQIARKVADIDAATAWYRDVLRLPHLYSFQDIAFFECNGVRLFLSATKDADDHEGSAHRTVGGSRAGTAGPVARRPLGAGTP